MHFNFEWKYSVDQKLGSTISKYWNAKASNIYIKLIILNWFHIFVGKKSMVKSLKGKVVLHISDLVRYKRSNPNDHDFYVVRKLIYCCIVAAFKKESQSNFLKPSRRSSLWKLSVSLKSKWKHHFTPLIGTTVLQLYPSFQETPDETWGQEVELTDFYFRNSFRAQIRKQWLELQCDPPKKVRTGMQVMSSYNR